LATSWSHFVVKIWESNNHNPNGGKVSDGRVGESFINVTGN